MKPTGALALLASLSVTAGGCGATKKKVVALPTMGVFSVTLDHRIGPVSFAEPKRRLTKALGPGVAAQIDGHRLSFYPQVGIYVAYPSNRPKEKQTVAALVITRSARYKTPSGVGVGSTLRQLRIHIKVRCYGGSSVSAPGTCQHERANTNLPFTVFTIDPTTRRVTQIAIVPGGTRAGLQVGSGVRAARLGQCSGMTSEFSARTRSLSIGEAVTYLFLVGMLVLGLVVPRWWTIGAAIGITILLFWVYDATHVHPQLESSLKVWLWFVASAAAGAAAGAGVLVRRLGRPRS